MSLHRVDRYAARVRSGDIVAGPYVRLACQRHERDRQREADGWAYRFDADRADHAIAFFETVLKLPDVMDDDGVLQPFLLQPWQAFIVGSLFGWVDEHGYRRFREAYVEIGKGNGKTPLCAGIGLYGLCMDGERAAEVYAAASDQDQAMMLFRDAVRMVDNSPGLGGDDGILTQSGGEHVWKIDHKPSLSFFKTFSRESGAKSGTRPHIGLLDELHEHLTAQISIKIRAGAKGRKQPLFVEITNSGFDRTSICWQHHEHSRRVVEGAVTDEQWFGYVCALDPTDDPLTDESCWPKVNPNQGVSIRPSYLRSQVKNAKHIPSETNTVLRLNFCVWTHAETRFIDMTQWMACRGEVSPADMVGARCYAGLDLGQTDDFSAFVRVWVLSTGKVWTTAHFWVPEATLVKRPDRPYDHWRKSGILTVTGGAATDYDQVQRDVLRMCRESGVAAVSYDKRFAEQMAQWLTAQGVTMLQTPQGPYLNEPLRKLSELVTQGLLIHDGNEIQNWMASNYVVREASGLLRPDKDAAADKIDGMVSLTMALDNLRQPLAAEPTYEVMVVGGRRR